MDTRTSYRTHRFRIIAQDPSVTVPRHGGEILTAEVEVPISYLAAGPWGYRVQVIDYDCTTQRWTRPQACLVDCNGRVVDRFAGVDSSALVEDPCFHAQNVYAIVMRTLARFEYALGRHVSWAGGNHHLKVIPHAFRTLNAFYSRDVEALLFGYFPARIGGGLVRTCLSHDVIAHETTHALLDALHERYMDPSSPDQAAFHEGFSDIVALLSVFALRDVVGALLSDKEPAESIMNENEAEHKLARWLKESALLGLADEMGQEVTQARGDALRRSVKLEKSPNYYNCSRELAGDQNQPPNGYSEYLLPHKRGEILVAAMMNAFVDAWSAKVMKSWRAEIRTFRDIPHLVEQGADAADYLLTMAIRALDYMPPLHIEFSDYLNALITADLELHPDDSRFGFRAHLLRSFDAYGIKPIVGSPVPNVEKEPQTPGGWAAISDLKLRYDRTHFEPLMRDPDEVFRFVWENRQALGLEGDLNDNSFMKVLSVRPCVRTDPDGFILRETVAQFYQVLRLRARELRELKFNIPSDLPADRVIAIYGGGTLVFDDYGRLKYYIHNALDNIERQSVRVTELWRRGALPNGQDRRVDFAAAHRLRSLSNGVLQEEW